MLLTLMYHKVGEGKHAHPLKFFREQFRFLQSRANVVLPGDSLTKGLNVCLTFDDATQDFYDEIYPLLQEFGLKALLAVPVKSVGKPWFCSWTQLKEMRDSNQVLFASHSYSHAVLTEPNVDLQKELVGSKKILEERLQTSISTFVYPYGKWNFPLQKAVLRHYRFAMRIGSATNRKWEALLYRVPTDDLNTPLSPFQWPKRGRYALNHLFNKMRQK